MSALSIIAFLLDGVGNTLVVTFTSFLCAMLFGLVVAVLRRLFFPAIKRVLDVMVFIFRGIPILIALFLIYFGLPAIGIKITPLLAMNLTIGLISGSYIAEVFRGALLLVDTAEITAAKASGMHRLQVITWIELPQMLRFSLPGILNEFSSVLKATPFAYTVGIAEITKQAMSLTAITMNGLVIYSLAGLLYFTIYKVSIYAATLLERSMNLSGEEVKKIEGKMYGINRIK